MDELDAVDGELEPMAEWVDPTDDNPRPDDVEPTPDADDWDDDVPELLVPGLPNDLELCGEPSDETGTNEWEDTGGISDDIGTIDGPIMAFTDESDWLLADDCGG